MRPPAAGDEYPGDSVMPPALDVGVPSSDAAATSRVLVVDDELPLLRALGTNLRARGYIVDPAPTGEEALQLAARHRPDAVILDLGLPGISGIEVIAGLRGWTELPIVVPPARGAEHDKVVALDAGAATTSPSPSAWTSCWPACGRRCAAALAHHPTRSSGPSTSPSIWPPSGSPVPKARYASRPPSGGWSRCWRNPGKLVSQRQLLQDVWGPNYGEETNYLRVYMPTSDASSNPTRPVPATSSPNPAWATASRGPMVDVPRQGWSSYAGLSTARRL
jgi:two-component system, OmpR family, KDP operon response regulator KdpE